jgi:uncharacterized phage protein (TIGR01671 family)
MRELKFRAFDAAGTIKGQKWYYFDGIFNEQPWVETSTFPQYESYPEKVSVVVMQYTGLHDKNGKKIYEGDIVEHQMPFCGTDVKEVIFADGRFSLDGYEQYNAQLTNPLCTIKVIGNIYENPELEARVSE